jgi:hypothetical protein
MKGLHTPKDRQNEEKTMNVDENVFFREATLRICSSLDIVTALKRCFDYIRDFIPANGMTLHILDPDLNLLKFVASVGLNHVNERILPLPEKGRDKRAADLQAAFLTNEGKVLILHPDKEAGLPEILEQLGINANISLMNLILQLEGNLIGTLALYADGLNQYTGEHARLLQLLHGPFAIARPKLWNIRKLFDSRTCLLTTTDTSITNCGPSRGTRSSVRILV